MKQFAEHINESLLDDEETLSAKADYNAKLAFIWKNLRETYGEILVGSHLSIENLELDKKDRIVLKNWPYSTLRLDLNHVLPEALEEYGFGDFDHDTVYEVVVMNVPKCKISQLGFLGKSPKVKLVIESGRVELDVIPNFQKIEFRYCNISGNKPKRVPRGIELIFDNSTQEWIFNNWCNQNFGEYARYDTGKMTLKL